MYSSRKRLLFFFVKFLRKVEAGIPVTNEKIGIIYLKSSKNQTKKIRDVVVLYNRARRIFVYMLNMHKMEVEVALRGKTARYMLYCACS